MKILLLPASLRKESCNKKLISVVDKILQTNGHTTDVIHFSEFELPLYSADTQDNQGFPPSMLKFIDRLNAADGFIISSPEYNFSTPAILKNLIDWVSRATPQPWKNKHILLLSASPSLVGGNRGLWHTRVPLECCGAFVYPDMFSLANAYQAFGEENNLKDPVSQERLSKTIDAFLKHAKK